MPPGTITLGTSQIRHGNDGDIDQLDSLLRYCIEAMRAIGIDQWDDITQLGPFSFATFKAEHCM